MPPLSEIVVRPTPCRAGLLGERASEFRRDAARSQLRPRGAPGCWPPRLQRERIRGEPVQAGGCTGAQPGPGRFGSGTVLVGAAWVGDDAHRAAGAEGSTW
jgi:hypothetical protein